MPRLSLFALSFVVAAAVTACNSSNDDPSSVPDSAASSSTATEPSSSPSTPSTPAVPSESATLSPTTVPTEEPAAPGPTLSVQVTGADVSPNAQAIDLAPGEVLSISVVADRAGQLHIHSKPDQYVDFTAGTTSAQISIDTRGVVDIEEHDTEAVVARVTVQ